MKKMMIMWLALAICALSVFPAMAEDVRRSFLINGAHQRYVPFAFNVPSINCGNLQVRQLQRSYPFFGQKASWELKYASERVPAGWYRFEIENAYLAACAPVIDIFTQAQTSYTGGFMEVEPEDLGLLVKDGTVPNNFFGLSEDDRQFSFELVSMGIGTERTLDSFINDTHFFSDSGKGIVGAIIADSRGFLVKKVMFGELAEVENKTALPADLPKGLKNNPWVKKIITQLQKPQVQISPSDIIVHEGEVLVLIRKENF